MRKAVFLRTLLVTCIISMISCTSENISETEQLNLVNDTRLEAQIMTLINSHRESIGLATLNFNDVAYTHANNHTEYMILKGGLSHDNFNIRASKISSEANAKEVGENVAKDYSTAEAVFNGWITSIPHKENIESDFTHTAISAKEDSNGNLYFTQIFFK